MIRPFSALDLPDAVQFFRDYEEEGSSFDFMKISVEKIMVYLVRALKSNDEFIWVDVTPEGRIKALLWGKLNYYVWSDDIIASDVFNVVRKEYRGGLGSYRLLKEFEKWGKANGAIATNMGAFSGIDGNVPALRLYEGTGYHTIGTVLIKEN